MKSRSSRSVVDVGVALAGLGFVGMAVFASACASTGRSAPVTGPEAEAGSPAPLVLVYWRDEGES